MIRRLVEWVDAAALRFFPLAVLVPWVRLLRGRYAAENYSMYEKSINWLKLNHVSGDFVEFGVGSGMSFCYFSNLTRRIDPTGIRRFLLFDSFEGLPEPVGRDAHPQWQAQAWAFGEKAVLARARRYRADLSQVDTIHGYYDEVLSEEMASKIDLGLIALVHIDCDLESSTTAALDFIKPFVQTGTIVLFDDFFCYSGDPRRGESAAFTDWCSRNDIGANPWQAYSFHGKAFFLYKK